MIAETENPADQESRRERKLIVRCILDIGERLLESGAEVNRVEDTMQRLGRAYGFRRIDVFTITSSINITADDGDEIYTMTRRIKKISVNMEKIMRCNELSRNICSEPVSLARFEQGIRDIDGTKTYTLWQTYPAYVIAAAAFTIFFGGNVYDVIAAGAASVVLRSIEYIFKKINVYNFVLYFINSLIVGTFIYFITGLGRDMSYDTIAMGNIMLLIPGLGLTTSIRDMLVGDMQTGMLGFLSAVIQAVAIALGFVCAAAIFIGTA